MKASKKQHNPPEQFDIFTAPMEVAMVTPTPAPDIHVDTANKMVLKAKLEEVKKRQQFFTYEGVPYMRIIPCKRLLNSTTIYEVVTRGSFFATNMQTGIFTVLPAGADKGELV